MKELAQQFAQVRMNAQHIVEGVGALIPGAETHHIEGCPGCKVDAALSAIERHVQDMEKALRMWMGVSPLHRSYCAPLIEGRCVCGLQEARDLTRAALPAREKEEGEFRITPGQAKTLDKAGDS